MDRLVARELFEERGRRIPGDALHFEEADIEPAGEQVLEVELERGERRVLLGELHQLGAHVDQELHAFGQRVELGQELDARRLERAAQGPFAAQPLVVGLGAAQPLPGGLDRRPVDIELGREHAQEALAPPLVEREIGAPQRRRARPGRDLAAFPVEAVAQLHPQPVGILAGEIGPGRAAQHAARRGGDIAPDMTQIRDRAVEHGIEEAGAGAVAHGGTIIDALG